MDMQNVNALRCNRKRWILGPTFSSFHMFQELLCEILFLCPNQFIPITLQLTHLFYLVINCLLNETNFIA